MREKEASLLVATGLAFSYTPKAGIIDSLDLTLETGEILCVLGPSGCGKSTLIKLLSGFLLPQEGIVRYRGRPVTGPFREGQMIFQDPAQLMPWLRVGENISFLDGRKADSIRLASLLELTGLAGFESYYPSALSGGMKQRCALGRALYGEPDILFMDEPFVSLDAPSRSELQRLILRIVNGRRTAVLFVTHDIREALILADRILVMTEPGGPVTLKENRLGEERDGRSLLFLEEEARYYSLLEGLIR